MTIKEKLIIQKLGYCSFAIYSLIKATPKIDPYTLRTELFLGRAGLYRSLKKLMDSKVITGTGFSHKRTYEVNCETNWKV